MTHFDVVLFWQLYQWAIVTKSSKLRGLNNNHLLSLFNGLWVNWAVLLIWARFGWCWLACSCVCDQLASGPRLAGLEWSSLYLGWLSTFCLGVMRWVDHIFYLPTVYVRLFPCFRVLRESWSHEAYWGLAWDLEQPHFHHILSAKENCNASSHSSKKGNGHIAEGTKSGRSEDLLPFL